MDAASHARRILAGVARSLAPARRETIKDWKLEQQRGSNEVPSFEKVLELMKTTDGWANEMENAEILGRGRGFEKGSPEWEEAVEKEMAVDLEERYHDVLWEIDDLDGEDCWRAITLHKGVDPRSLTGVGEYWARDPDAAEAYWGRFGKGMRQVMFRARIDSENIDKSGMVYSNLDLSTGETEKEVRFLKHAPVWVYDVELEDGTVVEINDWRRA